MAELGDKQVRGSVAVLLCVVAVAPRAEVPLERQLESSRSILEEIVVTAQRREERLLDVPISLSVLSDVAIDRLQIDDVKALEYAVPNLTVTAWPGAPARATIAMRGQVEPDRFPTVDPAVGVYLDGVYIARASGANLDLVDLERIEVLRGPQGTLYGRNTMGGAINLVPKHPDAELAGEVTAGAGNYDRRDLEAIVNVPFAGDRYAVRVAASHIEHSGYGRNTLLGLDVNVDDTDFVRAQFRVAPAERWDFNLSFDYTDSEADIGLVTLLAAFPPITFYPAAVGHPEDALANYVDPTARTVQANRGGAMETEIWGTSGVLAFDFTHFTVKALSAYRTLDSVDGAVDADGTPHDLFAVLARQDSQDQRSHELQAYGDALGDRLSWIGGLYWFDENATFFEHFHGTQSTTLVSSEGRPTGAAQHESMAAYAQLVFALTERLRVTGGARYNEDRRQLTSQNTRASQGVVTCTLAPQLRDEPGLCQATLPEREFSYVPWTLGVDVEPVPDMLLYAKASRGYRAGGYNFRAITGTDADVFDPESVITWEIGTRAELFDRRLRVGLTLYRSDFTDMQVRTEVLLPGGLLSVPLTQNAGEARIEGGELEVEGLVGKLRLSGALGITRGEYTELDPKILDLTLDSEFLFTPETTLSLAADLPIRTAFGGIDLHADYGWRDDEAFAYDPDSLARQDAYGLLNAMIAARFDGSDVELRLWARNLMDERYLERAVDFGSLVNGVPGDPRTYGASLTYRFGRPAAD